MTTMINESPSLCDCGQLDVEIWLQNFGCKECDARKITKFVAFDVQRTINEGGQGTLSFPLDQINTLDEVWPNQTAVIIKICGTVKFAGVIKELNLDAGIVSVGMQTWDEWLKDRYLHDDFIFGKVRVPKYNRQGEVVKEPGVDEVQELTIGQNVTGGTFTLEYQNNVTGPLNYNATAATIEEALLALSTIDKNDVEVTGGRGPGSAYKIKFTNDLGERDVDSIIVHDGGLIGGSATMSTVRQGEKGSGEDVTCVIEGEKVTAAEAVCRLVNYAGRVTPAHDIHPNDNDHPKNGVFEEPFCVPCIKCSVQDPNKKKYSGYFRYCDGTSIFSAIDTIRKEKGIEWITDAVEDPDNPGCWCFRFIVSDHIGSRSPYPVRVPGSALNVKPYRYDAATIISGKQCYPPPCPNAPMWPAGLKQWGGCYDESHEPRAIRETVASKDGTPEKVFVQPGQPSPQELFGQELRADACDILDNNPPRDIITARLVLNHDEVCQPGLDIGGLVEVDLGVEGGCFSGIMRVRGETFSADADAGLSRELQMDPINAKPQQQFTSDCDVCPDC